MTRSSDPEAIAALMRGCTIAELRAEKALQKARSMKADSVALQHAMTAPIDVNHVGEIITGNDLTTDSGLAGRASEANDSAIWRDQPNRIRPPWAGGPARNTGPATIATERGPVATKADFSAELADEATTYAANVHAIASAPYFTEADKKAASGRALAGHVDRVAALRAKPKSATMGSPEPFEAAKALASSPNPTLLEGVASILHAKPVAEIRANHVTAGQRSTRRVKP